MKTSKTRPRHLILAALTVVTTVVLAAPGSVAAASCISAAVPGAFVLPDGSRHAAGQLTLCEGPRYSPANHLHVMSVDGRALGMTTSRVASSEVESDDPSMLFARRPDGRLQLIGHIVPQRGRTVVHALIQTPATVAELQDLAGDEEVALVAGNWR